MTINWKTVSWMSSVLVAIALALYGMGLATRRDRRTQLLRESEQAVLFPLATGFGSADGLRIDPNLHCVTLPTGIRLAPRAISKKQMDRRFRAYRDWSVIGDRMRSNDDIYAYENIVHPSPSVAGFTGLGGGFVVLRGWCLVGQFHTWVE